MAKRKKLMGPKLDRHANQKDGMKASGGKSGRVGPKLDKHASMKGK